MRVPKKEQPQYNLGDKVRIMKPHLPEWDEDFVGKVGKISGYRWDRHGRIAYIIQLSRDNRVVFYGNEVEPIN